MMANPFFRLKIGCLKAMVRTVPGSASIYVKSGSRDLTDFAMTRLLIQVYRLEYCAATYAICQW
jgi:hypothetical protein